VHESEREQPVTTKPYLLDPAALAVRVVPCSGCDGSGVVPEEEWETDPGAEDEGIRACCEGYGVQLEVPAGAEHLIAFLAATRIYLPSHPDEHEQEVESFLADVEEQRVAGGLERFRRRE
jgi:hypothetical protein